MKSVMHEAVQLIAALPLSLDGGGRVGVPRLPAAEAPGRGANRGDLPLTLLFLDRSEWKRRPSSRGGEREQVLGSTQTGGTK
jgi:hypothetical protein